MNKIAQQHSEALVKLRAAMEQQMQLDEGEEAGSSKWCCIVVQKVKNAKIPSLAKAWI